MTVRIVGEKLQICKILWSDPIRTFRTVSFLYGTFAVVNTTFRFEKLNVRKWPFSRLIYTPLMRVLPSAQYWKILILNFFSQKYKNNIFHKNVAPPAEMISLTNRDPILHFFGSRCIAFDNYKLCRSLSKCLYFTPYENSMYSMYVLCVTFKAIYKTD